jgi:multidrug resistance protein MdtO
VTASTFASQSWAERIWLDLQPTPGRLAATLRIVLTTVIALILLMVWRLPSAALGLYVTFFIVRETPAMSFKSGFVSFLSLVAAVAAELAVVILSDNDPIARLLSVAAASFIAGVCIGGAISLPALASIWGLVYCILIALWERPAPPDALVTTSLYILATVSVGLGCSILIEYFFAFRPPGERLKEQFNLRYQLLDSVFTLLAQDASPARLGDAIARLNRLAGAGPAGMVELYNEAVQSDLHAGRRTVFSLVQITLLAELLDAAAAFASQHPNGAGSESRARLAEIAQRCREHKPDISAGEHQLPSVPTLLDRVEAALHALLYNSGEWARPEGKELAALPPNKVPFLIPGTLRNKDAIAFALKMTLCVMVCYIFYFAVDWPGISTAVTTVFVTALGNTGAIKQKMANRVLGSLIGGGIAIFATVFLFPHMDSITSLVILVGAVVFLAAWWGGGRQFGYTGLQIAFSFYLVAFEGFSAPTELAPPRDRMVGILVALVVIWLVYDQIWPVKTVTVMRRSVCTLLRGEARTLRIFESHAQHAVRVRQFDVIRDLIAKTIAGLRAVNDTLVYEFGADQEAQIAAGQLLLEAGLTTVPFFWNQLAIFRREEELHFFVDPELIGLRRKLAAHLEQLADAVVNKKALPILDFSVPANPLYDEYARHTIENHHELQSLVLSLASQA